MKLTKMEKTVVRTTAERAFTLIEMIGVLAVIAILAALLIPRVFNAINDARINSVCINCETIKSAVADHFGKYGKLDRQFGTNPVAIGPGYDTNVLMSEGLLDKPFVAKIAGGDPQVFSAIQLVTGAAANNNQGYSLDGSTNIVTVNAGGVIEAVLDQVTLADAKDLNDRIDGPALGAPSGQADTKGRVQYGAGSGGQTKVFIYITHR